MKTIALLLLCATASAQTFDYTGPPITGSASNGITSSSFSGSYTADLTVQGSLAQGNLQVTAYDVSFVSNQGSFAVREPNSLTGSGLTWANFTTSITLTTDAQGNVNGALMSGNDQNYNAYNMVFSLGSDDSFNYLSGATECWNQSVSGSTCSASASTKSTGTWAVAGTKASLATAAPEIDAKSGIGMFLLLAGGLAVVRGRRA